MPDSDPLIGQIDLIVLAIRRSFVRAGFRVTRARIGISATFETGIPLKKGGPMKHNDVLFDTVLRPQMADNLLRKRWTPDPSTWDRPPI
jgi:hypothetical protein